MTKLYLSCTTKDFGALKNELLKRLSEFPSLDVRETPERASTKGIVQRCFEDIETCDVYVGLVGFHYGWIPNLDSPNPEQLSMTELEYREARKLGKKRLIFLARKKGWDADWVDDTPPEKSKVDALRQLVRNDTDSTFESFSLNDSSELPIKIVRTLDTDGLLSQVMLPGEIDDGIEPYPGLFSFSYSQRRWYFGRENEIRQAERKLNEDDCNFLLVSGASGTGKSSLVEAGILPSLRPSQIDAENSNWFLRVRPAEANDDPIEVFANKLVDRLPGRPLPNDLVTSWKADPSQFCSDLHRSTEPIHVIIIDQLEELFTRFNDNRKRDQFIDAISDASSTRNPRTQKEIIVLASIRSDYRDLCQSIEFLGEVLRRGDYIDLFQLNAISVYDMIKMPAKQVQLDVSEVIDELASETSSKPAMLPLLAATLQALWDQRDKVRNRLTAHTLRRLDGIRGVIGKHADEALERFQKIHGDKVTEKSFDDLFSSLVQVDISGDPVRIVATESKLKSLKALELANQFAEEKTRLIYFSEGSSKDERKLEVVHESLFHTWKPLSDWIAGRRTHERELAQARFFADDWSQSRNHDISRLELVRLHDAHVAMKVLGHTPDQLDAATRAYLFPREFLKSLLKKPLSSTTAAERVHIGDLLDQVDRVWSGEVDDRAGTGIDSEGLPNGDQTYWGWIDSGTIILDISPTNSIEQVIEHKFRIAKFPITQMQFKAFVSADDGYKDESNWPDIDYIPEPHPFPATGDNRPVVNVAWIEATAFCRWLNRRLIASGRIEEHEHLRLPTEQEWQLASSASKDADEAELVLDDWETASAEFGVIAVGLSPSVNLDDSLIDFSSYIWEWCLNQFDDFEQTNFDENVAERAVRGGSFLVKKAKSRERFRGCLNMFGRDANIGFRVCIASKIEGF